MNLVVPLGPTILLRPPTSTAIVSVDRLSQTYSPAVPKDAEEIVISAPRLEEGLQLDMSSNNRVIKIATLMAFTTILANVLVHQIRPTQRTFTTYTTSPLPVNQLPTNAVGFGWHDLLVITPFRQGTLTYRYLVAWIVKNHG